MSEASQSTARGRLSIRDEQKLVTRRRLVESATDEFAHHGYAATPVEQIAKAAGTSRATFYLHYAGKGELAAEIWGDLRVRLVELHTELSQEPRIDRQVLEEWLDRTFDFYREHRRILSAVHEAIALEPDMSTTYSRRIAEVVSLIAPIISRARGVDEEHARLRGSLLVMQHERFCYFWILRGVEFDGSAARETVAQMWLDQLGSDLDVVS